DRFCRLVTLPRGDELVWRTLLARDLRGSGVGADQEHFVVRDVLVNSQHHVRERDPGNDVHLVAFDESACNLLRDIRLHLAIFTNKLYRHAAKFVLVQFKKQTEAIQLVLTDCGCGARKRPDKTYFYGLLGS